MKLVTTSHQFHKLSEKWNFKSITIYNIHLAGIETFDDEQTYADRYGLFRRSQMTFIEVSLLIYERMYGMYGDRCELLFTDTDSLAYLITTDDDTSQVFSGKRNYFDLSKIIFTDRRFHSDNNKKCRGALKHRVIE